MENAYATKLVVAGGTGQQQQSAAFNVDSNGNRMSVRQSEENKITPTLTSPLPIVKHEIQADLKMRSFDHMSTVPAVPQQQQVQMKKVTK